MGIKNRINPEMEFIQKEEKKKWSTSVPGTKGKLPSDLLED